MTTPVNGYITLKDFQEYRTSRGMTTNPVDDAMIEKFIGEASRAIDRLTHRTFIPLVRTRLFDRPEDRTLWLDDDLLAVQTLLNGDGTTIAASDYVLEPLTSTPHWALKLKSRSTVQWLVDDDGETEGVISLTAEWGYHNLYELFGWKIIGTMNDGNIDASQVNIQVSDASLLEPGHIVKMDNELMLVNSVASVIVSFERGVNGSTAAAHVDGTTMKLWRPMDDVAESCREIVNDDYMKRTGQVGAGAATVTPAGVVIRPQGFPQSAIDRLMPLVRLV